MEPSSNVLLTIVPLCCGAIFFLVGAGALVYALVQRKKAADTGVPVQNTNLFIILGAVFFVLSLCVCSLSLLFPLILNAG